MKLINLALAFAISIVASHASAGSSVYMDGGNNELDLGEQYVINQVISGSPTVFMDTHTFTLGSTPDTSISGSIVELMVGSTEIFGFSSFTAELFNNANELLQSLTFDGNTASIALTAGETYVLEVSGTTSGIAGGIYAAAVAPVPEPETWALMLAGLVMIGYAARRRNRRDNAGAATA